MKKLCVLLAMAMVLSVFAAGCGGGGDEGQDQTEGETKTLIVGVDDEFPPMGFVGDDGELTGFDIELAHAVGEKLGYDMQVQAIDWSAKEMELQTGNIDLIWNGYTITSERNEQVEFTKPYLNNQQVLVVANDSPYQSKADLEGKIVGAQVDSAGLAALQKDAEFAATLTEMPEYDTYMYALMDLGTSRLDAVVVDKVLIEYVMQQEPDTYRLLPETLGNEYYGIGCRQGETQLREDIDRAIDELMEDGTIDELASHWFSENIVIRDVEKLTTEELLEMEGAPAQEEGSEEAGDASEQEPVA